MFSPDGRWVLYSMNDASVTPSPGTNRRRAFVQPFPATGAKYLVPVDSAGHPLWRGRDNRLIFNTGPDASTAVTIRTTPSVTFSSPAPFSRRGRVEPGPATFRRNTDVLPDGRIIGVARKDESGDQTAVRIDRTILVVMNWFTELNRRVPPEGAR